jgi:EAL domain-containing protein (putative c-di-GMP-specific phosphodiesterase class I)
LFDRAAVSAGIEPDRLTIEIVEHTSRSLAQAFGGGLSVLRERGVTISTDDLGTGEANYQLMLECRPSEGVEHREDLAAMRCLGVELFQGYLSRNRCGRKTSRSALSMSRLRVQSTEPRRRTKALCLEPEHKPPRNSPRVIPRDQKRTARTESAGRSVSLLLRATSLHSLRWL